MVFIYCKTADGLKQVGQLICTENLVAGKDDYAWEICESDDDCYAIQTSCNKAAAAMLSRVSDDVVCIETDDNCAQKIVEPLVKKYGFNNVKWLQTK
ncbi:MAG: hypothetical protein NWF06_00900 [Candidatus Bathyarchaeota archaeon]|nr:hypothetical protein [Candidatus Bathyarchaeum sp.]